MLESARCLGGPSRQDAVAVVQTGGDDGVDECLSYCVSERRSAGCLWVIEGGFGDVLDV